MINQNTKSDKNVIVSQIPLRHINNKSSPGNKRNICINNNYDKQH